MVGQEDKQNNALMIRDLELKLRDLIDLNNANKQSNAVAESKLLANIEAITSVLEENPNLGHFVDVTRLRDRDYTISLEKEIESLIYKKNLEFLEKIEVLSRGLKE